MCTMSEAASSAASVAPGWVIAFSAATDMALSAAVDSAALAASYRGGGDASLAFATSSAGSCSVPFLPRRRLRTWRPPASSLPPPASAMYPASGSPLAPTFAARRDGPLRPTRAALVPGCVRATAGRYLWLANRVLTAAR